MIRFIRIYTPFIITLFSFVNAVLFLVGANLIILDYLFVILFGNSVLLTAYMYCVSLRMCIWYKLNLFCLFLTQLLSLTYNFFRIDNSLYLWGIIMLSSLGIIFFLIFKKFYKVEFKIVQNE